MNSPDKTFLVVPSDETCSCNDCPYMKLNTLEKLYAAMLTGKPEIILPVDIMQKARKPIDRMLELSLKLGLIK
jgi:quinolinate synthase